MGSLVPFNSTGLQPELKTFIKTYQVCRQAFCGLQDLIAFDRVNFANIFANIFASPLSTWRGDGGEVKLIENQQTTNISPQTMKFQPQTSNISPIALNSLSLTINISYSTLTRSCQTINIHAAAMTN